MTRARNKVALGALAIAALAIPQAHAGFTLPGDSASYGILYEGAGNNSLQFNNSNLSGNIGIGLSNTSIAQFAGNGPGTITGTVEFSNANIGQFSNSGLTITGGAAYNVANVSSDLAALNTLSATLGAEAGTSLTISSGGSVLASTGTLDGAGNRVFTLAAASNFPNGTFTITGNGTHTQTVVVNVPMAFSFNGSILLAGGLSINQVLFNLYRGSALTGGDTLTISTNGAPTYGIFLDPNGDIQINHSSLFGHLYGGDTHNFAFVSGANLDAPEPGSLALLGPAVAGLGLIRRWRRKHRIGTR